MENNRTINRRPLSGRLMVEWAYKLNSTSAKGPNHHTAGLSSHERVQRKQQARGVSLGSAEPRVPFGTMHSAEPFAKAPHLGPPRGRS